MATLEITTLIGCPLRCTFCPQSSLVKNYKEPTQNVYNNPKKRKMSFHMFKECIDKLPPHVRIDFSGMSEPFENSECMDFINYALTKQNKVAIYTTLSGISKKNTDELVKLLKNNRFHEFVIHLPDDTGNMRGFKLNEDYLYALEKLVPVSKKTMTMSKDAKIDPELLKKIKGLKKNKSLLKKLPKDSFIGWTRAGSLNKEQIGEQELVPDVEWKCGITCASTPFYDHNVLLPDGRVVICCMDYSLQHVIGNLEKQSYYELFQGEEHKRVTLSNMSTDPEMKKNSICTNCQNVTCWENKNGVWKKDPIHKEFFNLIKNKMKSLLLH